MNGFPLRYLVLGPYQNSGGAGPGEAVMMQDFLCDEETHEGNIVPTETLEIGHPAAGDCASADSAYLGTDVTPTVVALDSTGTTLNLNAVLAPNENVMAYFWVYIINNTGAPQDFIMGIASDDSLQVKINRLQVFNRNIARACDLGLTSVQDSFPVTLQPGTNLVQGKLFEGGGDWCTRIRLLSVANCNLVVDEDGSGDIIYSLEPGDDFAVTEATATRAVAGNDVTVTVNRAGAATYTLIERFDVGWTVSNITGGGTLGAGSITWTDISADNVGYRLTREGICTASQGAIDGYAVVSGANVPVRGDGGIAGCDAQGFVGEFLVTPSYNIRGFDGCTVTPQAIAGNWISGEDDDGAYTDRTVIPEEGKEFTVDYANTNAAGLTDLAPDAQDRFWTVPGDAAASGSRWVKASSTRADGYVNWQDPAIYNIDISNTMNVAAFYVINPGNDPICLQLGFGTDDSGAIRVNGWPIHAIQACRGNPGFADKVKVELDPGKNLITFYTFEAGGGYDAIIRFEDPATGVAIALDTTLDPTGYDPAAHPEPDPLCSPVVGGQPADSGVTISPLGFITQFLVPQSVLNQDLTSNTNPSAENFAYMTIVDDEGRPRPPSAENVVEGALVAPGVGDAPIGHSIRRGTAGEDCSFTRLVRFTNTNPSDPGLFDGELFYGAPDNYTASLFVFLNNKTAGDLPAFVAFASDDAASLYLNGELVLEFLVGRGFGAANTIQDGPTRVFLEPGVNLLQLSYTEGGGGSGARVRVTADCSGTTVYPQSVVEVSPNPPGADAGGKATRAIASAAVGEGQEANVTVTVEDVAGQYSLTETIGSSDWTISDVTGGGTVDGQTITWTNIALPSVGYKLTRNAPCTPGQGTINGVLAIGQRQRSIGGTAVVAGCTAPAFVPEVLVTASLSMVSQGCVVTREEMEGLWFEDGTGIEENREIIPAEGLLITPLFGDPSIGTTGTHPGMALQAQANFLGDNGEVKLHAVAGVNGLYDWQRTSIYGADIEATMNIAFFYVENETASPQQYFFGCGSDDAIAVRVDGYPVLTVPACRAQNLFTDKASVVLTPGKHLFSIYTFENTGGYSMDFRFEDARGNAIFVPTTLDPAGYSPADLDPPEGSVGGAPAKGYSDLGYVFRFLVSSAPLEQGLTSNSIDGAVPEDYISIEGEAPDGANVRPGAEVGPGLSGLITTGVRSDDGTAQLVEFNGFEDGSGSADPGLFDGEAYYGGAPDNYSSTGLFYLLNKTDEELEAFLGFASDDAAHLYVNGNLVDQFLIGRGYSGANTIQNGPTRALLEPGLNLVQISYTEGGGGSGFRVGFWKDCAGVQAFDESEVIVCLDPEADCAGGPQPGGFIRGNADGQGGINITDGVFVLNFLFQGGGDPPCKDAADADNSNGINITDGVYILNFLFQGGPDPAAPYPDCGADPDNDPTVDCVTPNPACSG